jgi:putative membrane protein insertion efficiency factor
MAFLGKIMGWTIRAYQLLLSPVLPGACRFYPSCSEYTREAIQLHGPVAGSFLALKRIFRCHPWGESGVDPVPDVGAEKSPARGHPAHGHR